MSNPDYLDVDPLFPGAQRYGLITCVHDDNDQTRRFALKLRGAFESKEDAGRFCERLNKMLPVEQQTPTYVVDLGSWLCMPPPTPEKVLEHGGDEVFQEEFLQKLMKGYRENQAKKDAFFAEHKNNLQQTVTPSSAIEDEDDRDRSDPDDYRSLL